MRTLVLAGLIALAACSKTPPEPATPAPASAADAVIAAERAFAADGAVTGWVEAFARWSEPDAILLGAGPVSARDFLNTIDPANRHDTSLNWAPEFAGVSAAGDFGFTTGPYSGGATFGYYFTVWRRQADGNWRWLYDGGLNTKTPLSPDPAFAVIALAPPAANEGSAGAAKASVDAIEAMLAASASANAPAAISGLFAKTSRMHRQDAAPAIGVGAVSAALAEGPNRINFTPLRSDASAGGDMVFTLGEARWDGGSGYYGRIWSREADAWRIVFDQIVPRSLPAKPPSPAPT